MDSIVCDELGCLIFRGRKCDWSETFAISLGASTAYGLSAEALKKASCLGSQKSVLN